MKTIIISDLHNRSLWIEEALSSHLLKPYDRVIFLGDYFDDYGDKPIDALNSAKWLKQSLHKPNRIHLYGTHDLWYRFPLNYNLIASGNTGDKYVAIQKVLTTEDWNLIKLYHYEQDYLITHAGVSTYLISDYVYKNRNTFGRYLTDNNLHLSGQDIVDKIVTPATKEAFEEIRLGFEDVWLGAGFARGGLQPFGGIVWLDWDYEFEPIPGLNQIVGHTEHRVPQEKSTENSKNYCLDTRNHHIGILENGKFMWIDNPYL